MVGLKVSMHFQQFEGPQISIFSPKEHASRPPKTPWRVSNRPSLGGIVSDCSDFP